MTGQTRKLTEKLARALSIDPDELPDDELDLYVKLQVNGALVHWFAGVHNNTIKLETH
jgi:hypothetical protein